MQFSYKINDNNTKERTREMMSLLGSFLLEIRKSMGNEATKLDRWQMLEWLLKDINEIKN